MPNKQKIFFFLFISIMLYSSFSSIKDVDEFEDSPKNIILLIGDGMGLSQVSAACLNSTKSLSFSKFTNIGFQTTHAYNDLITDSAAGATAMACGQKTYRSAVGVDSDTVRIQSILEEAEIRNLATGLVASSSIVHATPAGFYGHQPLRNFYEDLALDLANNEIDFLVGGGKSYFNNYRNDGKDLIKELIAKDYEIFDIEKKSLSKIKINPEKNFAYFTAPKQPPSVQDGRNYLPIAAKRAMQHLSQHSDEGFFLMIEGSQIDWAGHGNEGFTMLKEMADFDKAIEEALKFAALDKKTLVLVTADHETGGCGINPKSKIKKLRLKFTTNNHTGTMVPVYAYGPKSELFNGIFDNTDLYTKMRAAFGWD